MQSRAYPQFFCPSGRHFFKYFWGDRDSSGGRQMTHTGRIKQCKRMVIWMFLPLYIHPNPFGLEVFGPPKNIPKKDQTWACNWKVLGCSSNMHCLGWFCFSMTPWIHPTQTKHRLIFSHTLHEFPDLGGGKLATHMIGSATNVELNPSFYCKGPCFGVFFSAKMEDIHRFQVDVSSNLPCLEPLEGVGELSNSLQPLIYFFEITYTTRKLTLCCWKWMLGRWMFLLKWFLFDGNVLILGVVIIVEDVFCGKQIFGGIWSQVSGRKKRDFGIRSGGLLFILQYWGEKGAKWTNLGESFGVKLWLASGCSFFFAKQIRYVYM